VARYAPNALLAARQDVAPGLAVFRVAPEGWALPAFTPGQFAVVGLPAGAPRVAGAEPEPPPADPARLVRRAYSIASSSRAREYLELYVNLVRSGELTPRLFALAPGDRLWLGPKVSGAFTLDRVPAGANLALVATGTGLAPYMSMLRSALDLGGRRVAVVHGARHSWDLGYAAELGALRLAHPAFAYLPVVSRPADEAVPWGGAVGHVQDVWRSGALARAWGAAPSPADTHVLLCGNPAMVDAMTALLRAEGWAEDAPGAPGGIHVERYW
jgi:ferredoxin--NADP+ reductase